MSFKLLITQTKADGTTNKIELENSEAIQNQSEMLQFLRPLLYEIPEAANSIVECKPTEQVDKEWEERLAKEKEQARQEAKEAAEQYEEPVRAPQRTFGPPERTVLKPKPLAEPVKKEVKYADLETGVVQIHCPKCGLKTAKHARIRDTYFPCPRCDTKLFLKPVNGEVRGKPDLMGVSFRANNIYLTRQERWEQDNVRTD